MGEATYYLKARFNPELSQTEIDAEVQRIKDFFLEGSKAQTWWEQHRESSDRRKFWEDFKRRFPTVFRYLETCTDWSAEQKKTDNNNWPAGKLDFGDGEAHCEENDGVLELSAYVWHCAYWDPIRDFLLKEYKVVRCEWISDEHIEPFDLLKV